MDKFSIKKIIRSDGAILTIDETEVYLAADNQLLMRPDPDTTAVDYTEADGGEMVRQKNPTFDQPLRGLILSNTTPYWTLAQRILGFFKINFTYKIIYQQKNGGLFSVSNAWISAGIQIEPKATEYYSKWSVTLAIGDENLREYSEGPGGEETYANSITLPLLADNAGGENWNSVGEEWNSVGGVWAAGEGGLQNVNVASTKRIYPVWEVTGEAANPTLRNNTTDTTANYNGTVASGQTLIVDFEAGTAKLDGAIVTRNLEGIVSFDPGDNLVGFSDDSGSTTSSTIKWNNIIG